MCQFCLYCNIQLQVIMFLLYLVTLMWTIFFIGQWFLFVLTNDMFVLKSAKIVVCGTTEESVDVWNELALLPTKTPVRMKIMAHIMALAFRPDLRDVLSRCSNQGTVSSDPRVQKSPMCFLDIHYTMNNSTTTYRCIYPVYSFKEYVFYPPKPRPTLSFSSSLSSSLSSFSPLSQAMYPPEKSRPRMVSAVLTIRHDRGDSRRQVSMHVTDRVREMEGPFGNFHHGHYGKHVKRKILRVALMPEIQSLTNSLKNDDDDDDDENKKNDSSDSLDSWVSSKSFLASTTAPLVSIRLQIRLSNNRVEIISLETC